MSTFSPKKVAVLGAGVMGRQIACDLGDKGFAVTLFDLPGNAQKAKATAVKDGLCCLSGARRVVAVDNTAENHHLLGEMDWIVEAVFEDIKVKDEINQIIATHAKPGFFSDQELTDKVSTTSAGSSGDRVHEKLAITDEEQLVYCQDAAASTYRLTVGKAQGQGVSVTFRKYVGGTP